MNMKMPIKVIKISDYNTVCEWLYEYTS
jgi:hypothetical protein